MNEKNEMEHLTLRRYSQIEVGKAITTLYDGTSFCFKKKKKKLSCSESFSYKAVDFDEKKKKKRKKLFNDVK